MRRLALAALALASPALASCTQHADGTCLWVPGDDGTCSGRGGGGSYDPPPPHISFSAAAIAPGRVFVVQRGDGAAALLDASLDVRGLPTGALTPSRIPVHGALATWPSPDGVTLATMTSYHGAPYGTELALLEGGRLRSLGRLADTIPYQLAVVFDGEAFVVAWSEWTYAEERYRLQVARVFVDGAIAAAIEPIRYGGDDQNGAFGLATDGVGGVLLTRPVRRGWRLNPGVPLELEAVRLRDGAVVGAPWVFAADAAAARGCLGEGHALLAATDGYRLLTTRRACTYTGEPPTLVELRLDPEVAWVAEAPSPLALAAVPSTWIAGPGGFLAHDHRAAWRVDAAATQTDAGWDAFKTDVASSFASVEDDLATALK